MSLTRQAAVEVWLRPGGPPAPEEVTPGLLGLAVILALGVVTYLLWRSMNAQLRKVDFDESAEPGAEPPPDVTPPDRP